MLMHSLTSTPLIIELNLCQQLEVQDYAQS
jgi:hypothetical protein